MTFPRLDSPATRRAPASPEPQGTDQEQSDRGDAFNARWSIFVLAVGALVAIAGWQIAQRIRFPWDIYLWAESPFLTNMLKLSHGLPLYTAPSDANSFVYSPGLDYVTYALLRPFGRQLDIRYCRAVSLGFAVLAAAAIGQCASILRRAHFPAARCRPFPAVATGVVFLVIYHNYTSDVPHPDNVFMAHAGITLLLVLEALRRSSGRLSAAAVLFAALGLFFKQVAALSAFGACLALVIGNYRGLAASARLLLLAVAATGASLAALWSIPWCKFYTYDVLSGHGILWDRISELVERFSFNEYRLVPLLLTVAAVAWVVGRLDRSTAKYWAAVLVLFLFEFCPALVAYLKPMGWSNNLAILEVGMLLPVLPWLYACLHERQPSPTAAGVALIAALALPLCYFPPKATPSPEHDRYCGHLQYLIGQDVKAGKRVLVPHCATYLIRADPGLVPLDRSNSCLELNVAGKGRLAGTKDRVESRYYDTIYLNNPWYGGEITDSIERNYREVRVIDGPRPRSHGEPGFQGDLILARTRVMERVR